MSWLKPNADDQKLVDALASDAARAELYRLAQILALAVRVEPLLLRNARLHFLPASDTELETEFWWSSELIYTRNVQAAVMRSGIARALCNALLTEAPERFQEAKKLIAGLTRHWPETDRIEQDMRWAVLQDDTVALRQNIQRILKTLSLPREDSAKRELARWIKGALPALVNPEQAGTEVRWLYQYVSAALGSPSNWLAGGTIAEPLPESLIRALPLVEKQALGLQLHPGVLEILKPDGDLPTIEISLPLPTALLLSFDGKAEPRWENVWIGRVIKNLPDTNQIDLQTLNGDRFRINIEPVESPEWVDVQTSKPATRVVLAYMPDGVEQARMIARYLSEQGIEVDMTDDREVSLTVLSESRLVRLWTKQSAEYWQDRFYKMDELGKGLLVVTDGVDVSLPHSGVSDTEIIHLSNWEAGIDVLVSGKLLHALELKKLGGRGSEIERQPHPQAPQVILRKESASVGIPIQRTMNETDTRLGVNKRVYVSSTYRDLVEHREAVKMALERAQFDIECMEKYPAFDERPKDKCLSDVAECDYYVLILAWRYGYQPADDNPDKLSITQMEYEEAVRLGKKPLVFLLDPDYPWRLSVTDPGCIFPESAIAKFRHHVEQEHVCQSFTTPESLSSNVLTALRHLEQQRKPKTALTNAVVRENYLAWLLLCCESVELLGLDLKESQNVRLGQVYVPAVTAPKSEKADRDKPETQREERHTLLLHRLGEESLYLPGAPGAGKTTFCHWLALVVATGSIPAHPVGEDEEFKEKLPDGLRGRFPLFCRLREWAGHEECLHGNGHWTRDELEDSLSQWLEKAKPGGLTWAAFHEELQAGRALMILDGVDEVQESLGQGHLPRRNLLTGLADALPEWLKHGNRVLLTSRPYGLCNDDRRRVNLPVAELLELPTPLQDTFVRRWYAAADPPNADEKASGLLVHLQEREDLAELRRNPMLLTALCVMYDQGKRLPQDFYRLYDAVVGQVLYKRYLTENERDRARYRLEAVALGMHRGGGQTLRDTPAAEVDTDEIDRHLADYRRDDPTTEGGSSNARQSREDLLSNSGLLLPRADGRVAFYRLSFQEFLAAVRLKRIGLPTPEALVKCAGIPAWRRTLTFLFCSIADKDSPKAALDAWEPLLPNLAPERLEQAPNPALLLADCLEVAHGRNWNLGRYSDPLRQACHHALEHLNPPERAHLWRALGRLGLDDRSGVGVIAVSSAIGVGRNKPAPAGVSGKLTGPMPETVVARPYSGLLPDIDWVDVPEGPFLYGEDQIQKTLSSFKIARYPVTNAQFQCFIEDGGYVDGRWWAGLAGHPEPKQGRWNTPNQPRETVSWYEAVAYMRWLTAKLQEYGMLPEAMTVRLPTEEEWEKAARGSEAQEFPWGDAYESGQANINETWGNVGTFNLGQTTAVGSYPKGASPYGLLDMAGNVWEWCLNEYQQPERTSTEGNEWRVLRGGSWVDGQVFARCAFRGRSHPDDHDGDFGFRLVCCVSPPS